MESIEEYIFWMTDSIPDRKSWHRTLNSIRDIYETSLAEAQEGATIAAHNLLADKERYI
jgi:hypothetical protein